MALDKARMWPMVVGLVVAVVATWVIVAVATSRDPEDTVEDYLTAIADEDVAGALELVLLAGYGDTTTFLTPEAISDDWRVESVTETYRADHTADVKAVITGPGGSASGVFTVREFDDEWLLENPFVSVEFPASPVSYLQVNDQLVPRPKTEPGSYLLFPGLYRFYQTIPDVVTAPKAEAVAALPQRNNSAKVVSPQELTPGKKPSAEVARQLKAFIDDCAGFTTAAPYDCPFAADWEIHTPDGKRVADLYGLAWTVEKYPVVELTSGFTLRVTEPGTVRLTGSGTDTDDNQVTFTVTCAIDLTDPKATVDADGALRLSVPAPPGVPADTCRGNS